MPLRAPLAGSANTVAGLTNADFTDAYVASGGVKDLAGIGGVKFVS